VEQALSIADDVAGLESGRLMASGAVGDFDTRPWSATSISVAKIR
jgi:hypothetical protein